MNKLGIYRNTPRYSSSYELSHLKVFSLYVWKTRFHIFFTQLIRGGWVMAKNNLIVWIRNFFHFFLVKSWLWGQYIHPPSENECGMWAVVFQWNLPHMSGLSYHITRCNRLWCRTVIRGYRFEWNGWIHNRIIHSTLFQCSMATKNK